MVTKYFETPFANTGDKTTIPDALQPSGDVSFEEGWSPDYEKDQATDPDAKDVSRQSENYFKFTVTEALKEIQENGFKIYDALVNYPVGAITPGSDTILYKCLIVNGPDTSVVDPVGDVTGTWTLLIQPIPRILPRNSIDGLTLSNGTDADHDIDIAIGECRNTGNTENITADSAFVKQIDATWAAGTVTGGRAAGVSLSNTTWYHVFIIGKADDTDFDFGFDTSLTAANLLADAIVIAAGFTIYRRIGSVLTDGSANIIGFSQYSDEFLWDSPPLDISTTVQGATAISYALSTPLGVKCMAIQDFFLGGGAFAVGVYITSLDQDDEAFAINLGRVSAYWDNASLNQASIGNLKTRTDISSQIRIRGSVANIDIDAATMGYIDYRGKE